LAVEVQIKREDMKEDGLFLDKTMMTQHRFHLKEEENRIVILHQQIQTTNPNQLNYIDQKLKQKN